MPADSLSTSAPLADRQSLHERKLHRGHFAFLRAAITGKFARQTWDKFLQIEGRYDDAYLIQRTLRWMERSMKRGIEGELPAVPFVEYEAASQGLSRIIALLQAVTPHACLAGDPFQQMPLFSWMDEAALIPVQQPIEPTCIATLDLLASRLRQCPRREDPIDAWFKVSTAHRLESAGIHTLSNLVDRLEAMGPDWFRTIPAIGQSKASRLSDWLFQHRATLFLSGRQKAFTKRRQQSTFLENPSPFLPLVRPLEAFYIPNYLDGSNGRYRGRNEDCLLKATTDYEAVMSWLLTKRDVRDISRLDRMAPAGKFRLSDASVELSHTQRAYRKEAERFFLWSILKRGQPLSSTAREDCLSYLDFIQNPQPQADWCGPRSRSRGSSQWRPFEGPLSDSATHFACVVLKGLFGYLVSQNYLRGNPWAGVHILRERPVSADLSRSFSPEHWLIVEAQLDRLEDTPANRRLRMALHLLYGTGMRLAEVIACKYGHLTWNLYALDIHHNQSAGGCLLRVTGKGHRVREVPIPSGLARELSNFLNTEGRPGDLAAVENERLPLLTRCRVNTHRSVCDPIASSTLAGQIKTFFLQCAISLAEEGQIQASRQFHRASTHWIRHTYASHAVAEGMPIEIAQQNLGHASLATTTLYVRTPTLHRVLAVEKFWENRRRAWGKSISHVAE